MSSATAELRLYHSAVIPACVQQAVDQRSGDCRQVGGRHKEAVGGRWLALFADSLQAMLDRGFHISRIFCWNQNPDWPLTTAFRQRDISLSNHNIDIVHITGCPRVQDAVHDAAVTKRQQQFVSPHSRASSGRRNDRVTSGREPPLVVHAFVSDCLTLP
jgi:hypothetical protein